MATKIETAETSQASTVTETVQTTSDSQQEQAVVLTLKKPKSKKKVDWSTDTVDNEHLGRKKSKCCCVYRKPHNFDESSSESEDDECEHCQGHVELKKDRRKAKQDHGGDPDGASAT